MFKPARKISGRSQVKAFPSSSSAFDVNGRWAHLKAAQVFQARKLRKGRAVFARLLARITVLVIAGAVIGLIVGLLGKYVFEWSSFENPFWAVAVGIGVGAVLGVFVSFRVESNRKARSSAR